MIHCPAMTQITIPCGNTAAIRIPEKPAQPEQPVERIGVSAETAAEMLGVCVRTMWKETFRLKKKTDDLKKTFDG